MHVIIFGCPVTLWAVAFDFLLVGHLHFAPLSWLPVEYQAK